jgi:hypothetical protein
VDALRVSTLTDVAAWLGEFSAGDLSPLDRGMALAEMRDRKEDLDTERDQADRDAAVAERREALLFANHQAGDPLGQMSLARSRFAEYDDLCRDLGDQLRRAEAKRDRARDNLEFFAARAQETRELVSRSAPADPVTATVQRAREVHREFARNTRTALSDAALGRRPKGGGYAVRSEPVTCPECVKCEFTPEQSFWVHHSDADGNPLAAPVPVPATGPDEAERLMAAGYSRSTAELAAQPVIRR